MRFFDKLERAARKNGSLLCVGLDPDPALMPIDDVAAFNRAIIEATSDFVCAYKPNLAFYEALGEKGMAALRETLAGIPDDIPVIADAKRGDIGNTAKAYARALFDELGFDAVTVNPYLGGDAVEPFLEREEKGAFILCRTSNPGARDFQDLPVSDGGESRPLFEAVAEAAARWNTRGNAGLVVGATYPEELRRVRQICPEMTFLVPGVGAQGGDVAAVMTNGLDARGAGLVINVSRQVLYASKGRDFAQAAGEAARRLRDEIEEERRRARQRSDS
ncbi:MAG TPA: orotidine-5'-phosphate decarboxylase [Thermoleophilia bacterium]|nr:orotidine-5'-phosphate decarboxylase [Thermoleophilia bacterium]